MELFSKPKMTPTVSRKHNCWGLPARPGAAPILSLPHYWPFFKLFLKDLKDWKSRSRNGDKLLNVPVKFASLEENGRLLWQCRPRLCTSHSEERWVEAPELILNNTTSRRVVIASLCDQLLDRRCLHWILDPV